MIDVLGALMGIDIQASTRPEGSDEVPEGISTEPPASSSSKPQQSTFKPPQAPPAAAAEPEEDAMEVDEEEAKAKKDAEAAKTAGAAAYKKRDFDEAIKHFQSAWDLWPKDITFLTNLGGMFSRAYLFFVILMTFYPFQLHTSKRVTMIRPSRFVKTPWRRVVGYVVLK